MQLINTKDNILNEELMENSLSMEECEKLFYEIYESLNINEKGIKSFIESEYYSNNRGSLNEGFMSDIISKMTEGLLRLSKNKYRLTAVKMFGMSKELNDIYTKASDLLNNDVIARNKHKNDAVTATLKNIVLLDKKTNKKYYLVVNEYFYSINSIYKMINETITNIKSSLPGKEGGKKLRDIADAQTAYLDQRLYEVCPYLSLDPNMQVTTYNRIQLESALMYYKDSISGIYNTIKYYNDLVSYQVYVIVNIDKLYKLMDSRYGKDPDAKYFIDKVSECCLKNMTKCMEFNSKSMVIFEEMIRHYSKALDSIYNIIKS